VAEEEKRTELSKALHMTLVKMRLELVKAFIDKKEPLNILPKMIPLREEGQKSSIPNSIYLIPLHQEQELALIVYEKLKTAYMAGKMGGKMQFFTVDPVILTSIMRQKNYNLHNSLGDFDPTNSLFIKRIVNPKKEEALKDLFEKTIKVAKNEMASDREEVITSIRASREKQIRESRNEMVKNLDNFRKPNEPPRK
jgi:hypothetical protein